MSSELDRLWETIGIESQEETLPEQGRAAFPWHKVHAPGISCWNRVNTLSDAAVFRVTLPTVIGGFGPSELSILPVCSLGCICTVHGLSDSPPAAAAPSSGLARTKHQTP
jgi:hypothetical protein